jgi:formylglycine-generating enzyme required for sulfatase activity
MQGIDEAALDDIVALCEAHAGEGSCDREALLDHHRSETPARRVHVEPFEIDRTEVIDAAYARCVAAGACAAIDYAACTFFREGEAVRGGELPPARRAAGMPVVCVRWQDAHDFCAWQGKRLPSELEWEKAARGREGRRFPWGDAWDDARASWYDDELGTRDGFATTAPVGSFPAGASPYGALDMAGNVWEWVADAAGETEQASGRTRVMRGGGYAAKPIALRTTKRVAQRPEGFENVGFRCARSAAQPSKPDISSGGTSG